MVIIRVVIICFPRLVFVVSYMFSSVKREELCAHIYGIEVIEIVDSYSE